MAHQTMNDDDLGQQYSTRSTPFIDEVPYKNLELYVGEDKYTPRQRYVIWSSIHTKHPFAWPWVIYQMVLILKERAQKD